MTRISKQGRERRVSPRRPRLPGVKTGSKKDVLEAGYKVHENAIPTEVVSNRFIPKIG